MTTQRRETDNIPLTFQRSERISFDDQGYSYKTREGEIKKGFATRSSVLFDLNNYIDLVAIQAELKNKNFSLAA